MNGPGTPGGRPLTRPAPARGLASLTLPLQHRAGWIGRRRAAGIPDSVCPTTGGRPLPVCAYQGKGDY